MLSHMRHMRHMRLFRYEVHRGQDGVIPDLAEADGGPVGPVGSVGSVGPVGSARGRKRVGCSTDVWRWATADPGHVPYPLAADTVEGTESPGSKCPTTLRQDGRTRQAGTTEASGLESREP